MKMKLKELKNRENFQTENILIINLNDADKDQIELLNKEDH